MSGEAIRLSLDELVKSLIELFSVGRSRSSYSHWHIYPSELNILVRSSSLLLKDPVDYHRRSNLAPQMIPPVISVDRPTLATTEAYPVSLPISVPTLSTSTHAARSQIASSSILGTEAPDTHMPPNTHHVPISLVQGARNVYMQQPTITMVTADGSKRTRPQILAALRDNLLPRAQFAEYDAASPAPRNACTKNTRKAILDTLQVWASNSATTKVYWLNGMARTGKTTVAYSFSEILDEKNSLGGTFFSSHLRADTSDARCIIPTICLQLAKYLPSVSQLILDAVEANPDCQYWRIGKQFMNFIFKPLTTAYRDAGEVATIPVIVLDALDECSDQSLVTELLSMILKHRESLPVKFFITSRPEIRLKECFDKSQAHSYFILHDVEKEIVIDGGYRHHPHSNSLGSTTAASTTSFPRSQFLNPQLQLLHPSHIPNLINPSSASSSTSISNHQGQQSLSLLSAVGSASNPNLPSTNDSALPIHRFSLSAVGRFLRASLGSRSDRGAEVWGTLGLQGQHGATPAPPRRVNPYPRPNVSPRVGYKELELDPDMTLGNGGGRNMGLGVGGLGDFVVSAGFGEEVGLSRRGTYSGLDVTSAGAGASQKAGSLISSTNGREHSQTLQSRSNAGLSGTSQTDVLPFRIPITTERLASASHGRRKQNANFACPVPDCESTFTRVFDLEVHLRSHSEERPYRCHWPGCGKGFAIQHDCKRHEQLHTNFQPFQCEGCGKLFDRMDALNRHLRSEGGVDCAGIAEREKGAAGDRMLIWMG